jgi:hypothetical protein
MPFNIATPMSILLKIATKSTQRIPIREDKEKSEKNRVNHRIHAGVVPPPGILNTPGDPPRSLPRQIAFAKHRRLVRHQVLPVRHWRPCFPPLRLPAAPQKPGVEDPEDQLILLCPAASPPLLLCPAALEEP